MDIIKKYFKNLTDEQTEQFSSLKALYDDWNNKINVISRKDISNLYEHHVLHSLAIAKYINFKDGTRVMDVGTGGGFPGIPLAILFPQCHFCLVDSVTKKIKVATEISKSINLMNVSFANDRVENIKEKVDFVVSRAVMPLDNLVRFTSKNIEVSKQHNALPNGWICLKGGELDEEIKKFKNLADVTEISEYFEEEYFKTKKLVYLPYTGRK